jgi:uncharacterized protein
VLLPFRTRSDRAILWWAAGFLVSPVAIYAVLATNAFALLFRWYDLIISVRPAKVIGMFLLGLWTGRRTLHLAIESQRALLARLATICLPVGLVAGGLLGWADHRGMYYESSISGVAYAAIYCVGTHVLSIGYIAAFLLLWIGSGRAVLAHFEPVGRLALSNYLFQTCCIVMLLYSPGFGLALTLPVWTCLPIGLAIFAVQRGVSGWWGARHRYGPAEWVWRRMTYGRAFASVRA